MENQKIGKKNRKKKIGNGKCCVIQDKLHFPSMIFKRSSRDPISLLPFWPRDQGHLRMTYGSRDFSGMAENSKKCIELQNVEQNLVCLAPEVTIVYNI